MDRYEIYKKKKEPIDLKNFKEKQLQAGITPTYEDFREKEALTEFLLKEQFSLCCYCLQVIDLENAHNEHLELQTKYPEKDLDYKNLYACCTYSRGNPKNLQHCGEHKANDEISNFLSQIDCKTFFKYNVLGEILPNGVYSTEHEYEKNVSMLSTHQQEVFNTIKVLNLNCNTLVEKRKNIMFEVIKLANNMSENQINAKIQKLNHHQPVAISFVDLVIHFLQQKLQK